jgi:hypothetical protein
VSVLPELPLVATSAQLVGIAIERGHRKSPRGYDLSVPRR